MMVMLKWTAADIKINGEFIDYGDIQYYWWRWSYYQWYRWYMKVLFELKTVSCYKGIATEETSNEL